MTLEDIAQVERVITRFSVPLGGQQYIAQLIYNRHGNQGRLRVENYDILPPKVQRVSLSYLFAWCQRYTMLNCMQACHIVSAAQLAGVMLRRSNT